MIEGKILSWEEAAKVEAERCDEARQACRKAWRQRDDLRDDLGKKYDKAIHAAFFWCLIAVSEAIVIVSLLTRSR